jgi:hypothetical protein
MKRFSLTVANAAQTFSDVELASIQAVLLKAAKQPGRQVSYGAGARRVSAILHEEPGTGADSQLTAALARGPRGTTQLTDQNQHLTDC